jgi:hypothetical protein
VLSRRVQFCVILTFLTTACTTSTSSKEDSVEKLQPVQTFALPSAQSYEVDPFEESSQPVNIRVISAPDISARRHPVFDLGEKGYDPDKEPIKVQLLNYWDDRSNFFANINFKNTGRQISKNIYIFGYDRLGRLVSTRVNNTFFRTQQNLVRTLRFSKRDRAVRWTVLVKN